MRTPIPVVLALLLVAAPARAQSRAALDDRVLLGHHVRLQPVAAPPRAGVLTRLDSDSLSWRDQATVHTIARSALDSLWLRHSHPLAGGAIGALVAAAPIALMCAETLDECGLVPNGLVLLAGTAVVGTLIGSRLHGWQRIYP